ncbi:2-polyprenylphenol 6-hydroxylase [Kordiimonas sp. SCSIO 12610]|uniref:2-polyprenylphenol 6-hydroxylase n=1 Tax=Kordiimonas sp. SCSIO 12610 TaxID=2829597 RepID=UPI00210E0E25|nr:2-polyprenylphenol 6-hydroxylase [Kordiimonas sp. SCSIO 12610]UTW55328.1 2-polyprenylphenol 6-hydroxylase [Kordiimonas sp. SCSIO 12610]
MFRTFFHFFSLLNLAIGLRRFGAIRSLETIELIPDWAPKFLRICTFFVPRKKNIPDSDGERLAAALAGMGPAYIKLGQTLATRPDLVGRALAEGLTTLQDRLPPFSFDKVEAIIKRELEGEISDFFDDFSKEPVAAASIAQVHKAQLKDGTSVAVKVLRPDVEKRFTRDLTLFEWLAELADRHIREAKRLRLIEVVAKIKETSLKEMDLRLEASAAAELEQNMQGETGYRVPHVYWDMTARRVLTLEWVSGIRLNDKDALIEAGHDLTELGTRIVQIFLKQAMRDGYFHADLHQGNLLVEDSGTIVAIDFGIMGRLSKNDRRFLAEILFGFISRDYRRVAEVHFDAGYVPYGQSVEEFAQAMRVIADPIMDLPVEKISAGKLLAQLFATTERFSMRTQPQLLLLQRSMVMAEGLALHLNPQTNMWEISRPVIETWMYDNLSPEIRLADAIVQIPRALERLPMKIDQLLNKELDDHGQNPQMPHRQSLSSFALGLVIGAVIVKILFI